MVRATLAAPLRRIRASFALKLLVLFGVVLVVIGGIGAFIYVETAAAVSDDTRDRMERSTLLQAETLGTWAEGVEDQAGLLAEDDAPTTADADRPDRSLATAVDRAPEGVVAAHVVAPDGTVRASSEAGALGRTYDAAWVGSLPAGEGSLSDPYDDPAVEGAAVAALAGSESGESVVLVANLTAVSASLERPASSDASFTHVVDDEGTIVLSHQTDRLGTQNMGPADEQRVMSAGVRRGLAGETGYVEMDMDGRTMSMGYAPVAGTDWVVMTHLPREEAFALQTSVSRGVGALLLAALAGLVAVGLIVGRNTSRSIRDLAASAEAMEAGDLDVDLESDRTDEIGQLYDAFDSMRASLRESITETEAARDDAERRRAELAELADGLEATADEFATVAAAAAEGDLTAEMGEGPDNESMARIASEFNAMTAEMTDTLLEIRQFAERVAAHGQQVTASAEEVESASEQVSASMQTIADRTERQHATFDDVRERMEDVAATTEEIAAQSDEVAELAERTAATGERGRTAAESATAAMTVLDRSAERAVEEFATLQEDFEQIEAIAESIGEIAEQTNMLALNANIEASRSEAAEDTETGFAAVAQEVKEMSVDTRESAAEIESLVESLREQSEATAAEVRATRSEVAEHTDTVDAAAEALDEIAGYAEETYSGVQEITTATQSQAASAEEVLAMVEDAAELSEAVHEETGRVAAAAEEQTSSLTTVTEEAGELTREARELRRHIETFRIEGGHGGAAAADD